MPSSSHLQARPASDPKPSLGMITPAEERVLALLCRGDSNRRIAQLLVISPRTVESHVSNLLAKTGCRNRTQLTLWTQAQGRDGHW
ncbi:MAG: response regulator transcription factor [Cyanobium sp.]